MKRFQIPKLLVQRLVWAAGALALLVAGITWDYWRKTADNRELAGLRIEAAEQREQIEKFEHTLSGVEAELARVKELERKVRIIANLPGATGVGGEDVTEIPPEGAQGALPAEPRLPAGVPTTLEGVHGGQGGGDLEVPLSAISPDLAMELALTSEGARYVHGLGDVATNIGQTANHRGESLELLLGQLEDKSDKLASMPSVWPARGWLTSRFGPRVSPFTGRRQMHAGLDIAARLGTPIVAPARGRVKYVGRKGPLGNTVVLDHGFGVRTLYGHTEKIHVKAGQKVERGMLIASIGNSGRSTGPHLHYVVEVKGKARDPLDYIFD